MKRKALLVGVKPSPGIIGPWIRISDGEQWVVELPDELREITVIHVEEFGGTFRSQRVNGNSITPFSGLKARAELEIVDGFVVPNKPFSVELKEIRSG